MDVPTQHAIRAIVRGLASSGALTESSIDLIVDNIKNAASEAFNQQYEVDGRELQNLAVDIAGDARRETARHG